MDLDSLKDKARTVKAPEPIGLSSSEIPAAAHDLIAVLKAVDHNQVRSLRRARVFFLLATAIFLLAFGMTFLDSDQGNGLMERRMMKGSLVCVYILVSAVYFINVRKLSHIDYAVPVRSFLDRAELRYRFMRPSDWLLTVVGLLFVGVITSVGYVPYLSRVFGFGDNTLPMYVIFPVFLLLVAVMGLYFTRKNWERDRAPLWMQIRQMQAELEHFGRRETEGLGNTRG